MLIGVRKKQYEDRLYRKERGYAMYRTYASRAGRRQFQGKPWLLQIIARIWARNNQYAKCLGGE